MYKAEVNSEGQNHVIETKSQDLLFSVLREERYDVYAPCGGSGTCGKGKVWIKGKGIVTSCFFSITEDLIVQLPDWRESQILVDQHNYTQKLPLYLRDSTRLSSYPNGVAIDIGTTTLVFYLVDLITGVISETRAVPNPQAKYGSDVISRINYTAQHEDGLNTQQKVLVDEIDEQLEHFIKFIGIKANDIVKVIIDGNTILLHILLGINPLPLALAPFTPEFTGAQLIKADHIGLKCNLDAHI